MKNVQFNDRVCTVIFKDDKPVIDLDDNVYISFDETIANQSAKNEFNNNDYTNGGWLQKIRNHIKENNKIYYFFMVMEIKM